MHGKVLKCIGAAWNQYVLKQNTHRKKERNKTKIKHFYDKSR